MKAIVVMLPLRGLRLDASSTSASTVAQSVSISHAITSCGHHRRTAVPLELLLT